MHAQPEGPGPSAREVIVDALERILAAGARDGSLRDDHDAEDVLALLAGLGRCRAGRSGSRAERLAAFVVEGLTPSG